MRQRMKQMAFMILSVCMVLAFSLTAMADSTEVDAVGDSVLQFRMVYETKDDGEITVKTGCCILLNETQVLTNYSLYMPDEKDIAYLEENWGADFETNYSQEMKKIGYRVTVRRDNMRTATIKDSLFSELTDFAVFNLDSVIGGRKAIVFRDSDDVNRTDGVHTLGFPVSAAYAQDIPYYTRENIEIQNGNISNIDDVMTIPVFQHNCEQEDGTFGGPLVDDHGYLIGLNSDQITKAGNDSKNYAVRINEIREYLDADLISYEVADEANESDSGTDETTAQTDETAAEPDAPASVTNESETTAQTEPADDEKAKAVEAAREALEEGIEAAEDKIAEGIYTNDSVQNLQETISSANDILDDEDASESKLSRALTQVEKQAENLTVKTDNNMMVLIIAIAVVVVIILIVIIVIIAGKGKKKKALPTSQPIPTHPGTPINPGGGSVSGPKNPTDETGLLMPEAGATDILGVPGGAAANAYLVRKKTGERANITTQNFTIGKEMGKVDYCIADNSTVSRVHATISRKGDKYVIVDQRSKNGTYLNNVRLIAGEEQALKSGDTLRLSDEVLEFIIK